MVKLNVKEMNEVDVWVEKVKHKGVDLSLEEDLSIGLMNLVSLEEHFFFSAMKTNDDKYLELLNKTRELRKKFLAKFVVQPDGEEWCISKHLLAASMRLYEVGTKELANANKQSAKQYFDSAFQLYSLFFAINLKLLKGNSETAENDLVKVKKVNDREQSKSIFASATEFFKKAVDCCKE